MCILKEYCSNEKTKQRIASLYGSYNILKELRDEKLLVATHW